MPRLGQHPAGRCRVGFRQTGETAGATGVDDGRGPGPGQKIAIGEKPVIGFLAEVPVDGVDEVERDGTADTPERAFGEPDKGRLHIDHAGSLTA